MQGSGYPHLREECACALVEHGFLDGYAIGGVSVGEPEEEMYKAIDLRPCPIYPPRKSVMPWGPRPAAPIG